MTTALDRLFISAQAGAFTRLIHVGPLGLIDVGPSEMELQRREIADALHEADEVTRVIEENRPRLVLATR